MLVRVAGLPYPLRTLCQRKVKENKANGVRINVLSVPNASLPNMSDDSGIFDAAVVYVS